MTNDADHNSDGTSPTINSEIQSSSSGEDVIESPTRRFSLSDAQIVLTYVQGMMMKQKEIGNDDISKSIVDNASVSLLKTRESLQKLQEYESYIEQCDNNEDWSLPVVDKIPRIPWSPPLPPSKPKPMSRTHGRLSKSLPPIRISNMNDVVSDIESPIVILESYSIRESYEG